MLAAVAIPDRRSSTQYQHEGIYSLTLICGGVGNSSQDGKFTLQFFIASIKIIVSAHKRNVFHSLGGGWHSQP
jgi:hypothetical protein